VQTIIVAVILAVSFIIIRNVGEANTEATGAASRRRAALKDARIYLAPYSDIWRNLRLSNKYCTLRLGADGRTIIAKDSVRIGRSFVVIKSAVHSVNDLWDMYCMSYSHNTTFDELIHLSQTFKAQIEIKDNRKKSQSENPVVKPDIIKTNITEKDEKKEKLDVNNASEVELTALPGISIVLAKKIIKKREDIGGFKDVNTFLEFTGLKPHMRLQLRDLICVNKLKSSGKIKRNQERSIDL
jgi:DNA uptake protein ComE-like DNA-binding protein